MAIGELVLENVRDNQYRFRYPRFVSELDDLVFEAVDLLESDEIVEAKKILHSVIDSFPNHIDAHHYLALCLHRQGERNVAFRTWLHAVRIGVDCLPQELEMYDIKLEWGWLENRPFLRAYHALAIEFYERGDVKRALSAFNNLLTMNPFDNQGVRVMAIKANFELKRPREIVEICNRFPDDGLAETFYGRLLAVYQLNGDNKRKILKEAIELLPVIAQEIVKVYHSEFDSLLYSGSFDDEEMEAIEYWQSFGKYWKETKGAIQFVEDGLAEFGQENQRT